MTGDGGDRPIPATESIANAIGRDTPAILRAVANRYVGDAPRRPFTYRATPSGGVHVQEQGRTHFDFATRFPDRDGTVAYAWGQIPPSCDALRPFTIHPAGVIRIYVDGDLVVEGDTRHESGRDGPLECELPVTDARNDVVIACERTPAGFGGTIEPTYSWAPLRVLAPTSARAGQAGWIYTPPLEKPVPDEGALAAQATSTGDVEGTAIDASDWHPRPKTADSDTTFEPMIEADADASADRAIAWTTVRPGGPEDLQLHLDHDSELQVLLDGETIYDALAGEETLERPLGAVPSDLVVSYDASASAPSFQVDLDDSVHALEQPHPVAGTDAVWFHAGPLDADPPPEPSMEGLVGGGAGGPAADSADAGTYWRSAPETWVRPYAEEGPFGTWSYPVGVTLYGLLETGRWLERPDLREYVRDHLHTCTSHFAYQAWDGDRFGHPAINEQLAGCSMLDHCGSMAATLLEAVSHPGELEEVAMVDAVAEAVGSYMLEDQERLPDGTFYRSGVENRTMNETLWADDLYMSTPFLARYADYAGRDDALDDAIHQFERFEHYLGLEDPTVLSHVYDHRHEAATGVPWGRGNGWSLFSLAETLDRTPAGHPKRDELLDRFERFAEGYRSVQAEDGFWHQVLTDPDAYKETSCTAMFTWAFARGVRRGWLPSDPYARAARDGWRALTSGAIDADGNVHGVCHGSSYSFSPEYYKQDLDTVTNDLHGIGIVLLAGVEAARLAADD